MSRILPQLSKHILPPLSLVIETNPVETWNHVSNDHRHKFHDCDNDRTATNSSNSTTRATSAPPGRYCEPPYPAVQSDLLYLCTGTYIYIYIYTLKNIYTYGIQYLEFFGLKKKTQLFFKPRLFQKKHNLNFGIS